MGLSALWALWVLLRPLIARVFAAALASSAIWALAAPPTIAGPSVAGSPVAGIPGAGCPLSPSYPLPPTPEALRSLLKDLDALAGVCLNDAPFHAWRGAVLMALGEPVPAIEALERALLIDPQLAGAQLDYAQALAQTGDVASARGLLIQLAERSDLPAHLRPGLERALADSDPHRIRSRWLVTAALGHDNNLNNAPSVAELTLTFPQGAVTLPVAPASRPQAGMAGLAALQGQAVAQQGAALWLAQLEARARQTSDSATDYVQGDLSIAWLQAPEAPQQWIARAGVTGVKFGGDTLVQALRVSLMHQWRENLAALAPAESAPGPAPDSPCRLGLGPELERRTYPVARSLDGRYTGVLASALCGQANAPWGLQLRLGREDAHAADRPGGDYRRGELRAHWEAPAGPGRLSVEGGLTRQLDSRGFSPLLDNNRTRQITRTGLRLEYALTAPGTVFDSGVGSPELFVSFDWSRQASNLAAFESRQTALFTGLRWLIH